MMKNWRDLIKPRGLSVDQESLTDTYGKFIAEPLERGFGITLGNAARRGRGYVPAERNKVLGAPIGVIPVDSLFSPIKKVNYQVTNARVGQVTDYDRLALEVWTNGSVSPSDAVAYGAKIVKEQLSIFINFDETQEPAPIETPVKAEEKLNENLFRSVDELELSVRSANCLQNANIKTIGDVVEKIITKAREGTLTARRNVHRTVRDQAALAKLFETIAPRFKTRPGGYTRIVHVQNRVGDNAPMAILELVEKSAAEEKPAEPEKKADKKAAQAEKKPAKVKAAKGGGEQGSAEAAEKKPPKQKKQKKEPAEEK